MHFNKTIFLNHCHYQKFKCHSNFKPEKQCFVKVNDREIRGRERNYLLSNCSKSIIHIFHMKSYKHCHMYISIKSYYIHIHVHLCVLLLSIDLCVYHLFLRISLWSQWRYCLFTCASSLSICLPFYNLTFHFLSQIVANHFGLCY